MVTAVRNNAYKLPDGTNLLDHRIVDGRPAGIDSEAGVDVTYIVDEDRHRLVNAKGKTVREITAIPPGKSKRRQSGTTSTSRPDSSRWATLNTFVDVIARHLSPVEIAVWLVLFRDCRRDTVEASQRNLATRSGACERSVVRAMRTLRTARLVEVVKVSESKGEASLYRLEARPERCLDAIRKLRPTGDTMAPDRDGDSDDQQSPTGATMAPVQEGNR